MNKLNVIKLYLNNMDIFEDDKIYKKIDFINGINVGREFSRFHMAIVFSL